MNRTTNRVQGSDRKKASRRPHDESGFTLVELMICAAILVVMAAVASASYSHYLSRSRRTEGEMGLHDIARLQKAFYVDNGRYATNIKELGFSMSPGKLITPAVYEGRHYRFTTSWRDDVGKSYMAVAVGNIDLDEFDDMLLIHK